MEISKSISFLEGNNFSGRTDYFNKCLKQTELLNNNNHSLLLKEQPTNNISGIFPTVAEELRLHCMGADVELEKEIYNFLQSINFVRHFDKNPFSLSGGEQAILAIVNNLLLNPTNLYIDSTTEQLNESWYTPLFNFIQNSKYLDSKVFISDNRYKEYTTIKKKLVAIKEQNIIHKYDFQKPQLIDLNEDVKPNKNIRINNLSFNYKNSSNVFNEINYSFNPSTIYHLKGKNGAGKSTLAKILVGILKIKGDELLVNDKFYNSYKQPGTLCGYSFQNPDEQLFSNSIEKEVLPFIKNEPQFYTARRETYLTMFGLQAVRKYHPAEMPFVMRKRITLASTLAMEKPWYIFDEPTLGQDDSFVFFFAKLVNKLKDMGKGIIIITHCSTLIEKTRPKVLNL